MRLELHDVHLQIGEEILMVAKGSTNSSQNISSGRMKEHHHRRISEMATEEKHHELIRSRKKVPKLIGKREGLESNVMEGKRSIFHKTDLFYETKEQMFNKIPPIQRTSQNQMDRVQHKMNFLSREPRVLTDVERESKRQEIIHKLLFKLAMLELRFRQKLR